MKKILFVINTLGRGGAETALLELLYTLEGQGEYEISLYVLMGQGELRKRLSDRVRLLNSSFSEDSVLSKKGKYKMVWAVCRAFIRNGHLAGKIRYAERILRDMRKIKQIQPDKILWRVLSDGSERFDETYDLAVAYLEGGSTYYVADHVKAKKKAAFVHIDYESSGYTRQMDRECYQKMDRIFTVSDEVREHFLKIYPQYAKKTEVFHNIINQERIRRFAGKGEGFRDHYDGIRILTVGRLTYQKAFDIAIEAMKLVKDAGYRARWYVLGEGNDREMLEKQREELGLTGDFLMPGAVANPFPYFKQSDIYVHASRFEGKSIAIQEAQTLGCAIIASDCNGNREQIIDGEDGLLCELTPEKVAEAIIRLIGDKELRHRLGSRSKEKKTEYREDIQKLLKMVNGSEAG